MLLRRTEKGHAELTAGVRTLSLSERSLLLMADGGRSVGEISSLAGHGAVSTVTKLVQSGYLEPIGAFLRPAVKMEAGERTAPSC
jgi:hypothetical protein